MGLVVGKFDSHVDGAELGGERLCVDVGGRTQRVSDPGEKGWSSKSVARSANGTTASSASMRPSPNSLGITLVTGTRQRCDVMPSDVDLLVVG